MKAKIGAALAAAFLTAGCVTSIGGPRSDTAVAMLRNRMAIETLLVRYSTGLDTLDADLYASCFAEDASFGEGERARKGRSEIRKVITELIASREQRAAAAAAANPPATPPAAGAAPSTSPEATAGSGMHHVISNSVIELVDGAHARHYSYWMTVIRTSDNQYRVAGMGRYEDQMAEIGGKWLFTSRKILR